MNDQDTGGHARGGRLQMPRSRGAASGFLLILLGAWGALIPFIGPYFDFAWGTDQPWTWTTARGWLEVLPGIATVVGGLLLLTSKNRATAILGGWISVIAGAWFVVGRSLADSFGIGDVGRPLASTDGKFAALDLAYFNGLGVLIVFLGAAVLGRLSVRSVRDVQYAQRPVAAADQQPAQATASTTAEPGQTISAPASERTATEAEPKRRGLGGLLHRRPKTAETEPGVAKTTPTQP